MHRTLEETEIGAVNEFQISRFVNFVNGLEKSEKLMNNLQESTDDLYNHFGTSQRVVRHFQDHLTRISAFLSNRENVMDDIAELLKKSEVPEILKQKIIEAPVDENYGNLINELRELIEISKELKNQGYIVGFEMQKDLDPLIDKSVKKILSSCTELLVNNRDMVKMTNWHDIQQQNLIPKSDLIVFVEENRASAGSNFIGKYFDLSSTYYAACSKKFFIQIESQKRKKLISPVLIGDPIEGDDSQSKFRRRSSTINLNSLFFSTSIKSPIVENEELPSQSHSQSNSQFHSQSHSQSHSQCQSQSKSQFTNVTEEFSDIPFEAANLLIELLKRESSFFKEFFGFAYVRRKNILTKIFSKCFSIIKNNLKEIIYENNNCNTSLKMMSEMTNLELKVVSFSDLSTPTQWLNEIQSLIYENFKRLLKKQIESLSNYPELKIQLSSGEIRHHYVVKRFAIFMKTNLKILQTFQRPWDIIQVDLKKLENEFYNWMIKISSYLKDKRESLLFQINNLDLIIETCSSVAGADFLASLHFKFDSFVDKFIKLEQEKYFSDLFIVIRTETDDETVIEDDNVKSSTVISKINSTIPDTFKAVAEAFKFSTFTDFSSLEVSQKIRERFAGETLELYTKYFDFYDRKFGKNGLNEGVTCPIDVDEIKKILYKSLTII